MSASSSVIDMQADFQDLESTVESVTGEYVVLDGEQYFCIANSHEMPDFFMSLVGSSDHWMFISSSGALTAGRCDPDNALFPYAADDQISVARPHTGPLTRIQLGPHCWQPFLNSASHETTVRRNLYKNPLGNKVVFEEIHPSLQLTFRYRWAYSEKFGFVRSCWLENNGESTKSLKLLDGLQNLLPYGVSSDFMMRFSNLANAYKKSELLPEAGVGLYYLSSIPTDRAEPSEGLKTTVVWQTGLSPQAILLSTEQIRSDFDVTPPQLEDVRGKSGAFLCYQELTLDPGQAIEWHIVADLAQDHSDVIALDQWLRSKPRAQDALNEDIAAGHQEFMRIASSSDGIQCSRNLRRANRHLGNTVFNVMRGGVPLANYTVQSRDFCKHVATFNAHAASNHRETLETLPAELSFSDLQSTATKTSDPDLIRLASEYLPLAFSRRHGDPTRPWNRFAIQLRSENGETNLNYQGNWRDIFQNWEALAVSFPEFSTAMICRFVNATTADGYNPYRVTKNGFEWEEPTPDDPWANIGYWGDHQIIYLLKFLEWNFKIGPENLASLLNSAVFVHANVPYRIKDFEAIKQDPQDTIEFDQELSESIAKYVEQIGADGKLLFNRQGEIQRVTLLEKLLTLSLAKLSNFVPQGGIWLNTQRPEWNDANNALVGNGLSMVTTCYLYRWFEFLLEWLQEQVVDSFTLSEEVIEFADQIQSILAQFPPASSKSELGAEQLAEMVQQLCRAGSAYRKELYEQGPSGNSGDFPKQKCLDLFEAAKQHLGSTIRSNRRPDGLYHSYNLLRWTEQGLEIDHLDEMLEGQVSALSSGLLDTHETLALLNAMRSSALYRENQDSYMLYPDKQLPRFLEKNRISTSDLQSSQLLQLLVKDREESIVRRDVNGEVHFNGSFRNVGDLQAAMKLLPNQYQPLVAEESARIGDLFIDLFAHRQFTGRSGTFFAYEGLGSIYWHMVSKLGLAVAESFFKAVDAGEEEASISALRDHFQAVRRGIGSEKSPIDYGGFPTDPYSHTPENSGVKQPGMTGQVKEDVLARFSEIGVHFADAGIQFQLELFDREELLDEDSDFRFFDVHGSPQSLSIPAGAFAFTLCQVPIIYQPADEDRITLHRNNAAGESEKTEISGRRLDPEFCRELFSRTGKLTMIECSFAALRS